MNNFDFIESIHDVDLGECPIFVCAAVLKPDFLGRRRIVSGKGTTREEALQSCLAEAMERWCAVFRKDVPGVWGTEHEMAPAAISPRSLLLISDKQYARADEWNRRVGQDHQLPHHRASDQPIFWVEAKSIAHDTRVLIPAACCFLGYPNALEQGFPVPDSNGLAASQTLEACVGHGLLELIERDAVSIWWYGQIGRAEPPIDRSSSDLFRDFEAWIRELERKLHFLDLTTDLEVPVVAALTSTLDGRDLSFGFGAGWTYEAAARGALGELAQFEATKRLRRHNPREETMDFVQWSSKAHLRDHPFLQPSLGERKNRSVQTKRNLAELLRRMGQNRLEVFVLNLSRDDMPFSIVRAISPGLRPLWPRFAPGRLYDVPLALNWKSAPLTESQVNPVPILY